MHRIPFNRKLIFILLIFAFIPVGIEVGARVVYVLRYDNLAFLHYPKGVDLALNTIVTDALAQVSMPMKLPPGQHEFIVNKKRLHSIAINQSGFRGQDFEASEKARWTVVTMGGSSTFSSECPEGTSYPEQMERLWQKQYGENSIKVINRGMNGMTTHQVALLFQNDVAGHHPDLVTICSAFNGGDPPIYLDLRPGSTPFYQRWLWGRSLFYTALFNKNAVNQLRQVNTPEGIEDQYRADLLSMVKVAKKAGIALVFIQQPLLDTAKLNMELIRERTVGENREMILSAFNNKQRMQNELNGIMARVAKENQFPLVDPRPALTQGENPQENFWIALHLSPHGAKLMAEEIVNQIQSRYGGLENLLK